MLGDNRSVQPQLNRKYNLGKAAMICGLGLSCLGFSARIASADDVLAEAKKAVAQATQPMTEWTGPTTGPKAQPGKRIVYLSNDEQNDAAHQIGLAIKEAAGKIGWSVTVIDGHSSPVGWQAGMDQAIALKADGVITTADIGSLQSQLKVAADRNIMVVGVHAAALPGPQPGTHVFYNVQVDPRATGRAQADWIIAHSNGTAHAVITTHSEYQIAFVKATAVKERLEQCTGCKVLEFSNSPVSEAAQRQPQLIAAWVQKYKFPLYITAVSDYILDFQVPALRAGGVDPKNVILVGADGNVSGFERIRAGDQYELVDACEPYVEQAYHAVDELNRALNHVPPSGFVEPVYLLTHDNIHAEGGDTDHYSPTNGFKEHYLAIWGAK